MQGGRKWGRQDQGGRGEAGKPEGERWGRQGGGRGGRQGQGQLHSAADPACLCSLPPLLMITSILLMPACPLPPQVMMTPILAVSARMCPPGIEATLYATLYSFINLSTAISTALGAAATEYFKVGSDTSPKIGPTYAECLKGR